MTRIERLTYKEMFAKKTFKGKMVSENNIAVVTEIESNLELFDQKAEFLENWCMQYEKEHGKWPSVKTVFEARLDGFKSKAEVTRMMIYIKDCEVEQISLENKRQ